jgi:hypothetical protein
MKKITITLVLALGLTAMAPTAVSAAGMIDCPSTWTKTAVQKLTADEIKSCIAVLPAKNIAQLNSTQIVNLDWNNMQGLSGDQTKGWTSGQIVKMTADQLKGLIDSNELTTAQLTTVTSRYKKLTSTKTAPSTTVKKSPPTTAVKKTPPTTAVKTPPTTAVKKTPPTTAVKTPVSTTAKTPPTTAVKKTPPTTAVKTAPTTEVKTPPTTEVKTPPTTAVKTPPTTAVKRTPPTTVAS